VTAAAAARRARLVSPVIALLLGGLVLVLAGALIPLSLVSHANPLGTATVGLGIAVPFAAVGVVVARRQPRNAIGWIMLAAALCWMSQLTAQGYSFLDYRLGHHLPFGPVALLLVQSWVVLLALLPLVVLLFPDGRLPSPRWRWPLRAYLALGAVFAASLTGLAIKTIIAGHIRVDATGQLTAFDNSHGASGGLATAAAFLVFVGFWLSFVIRQVITWRRSSGERRQQFRWLMTSGAVCLVLLLGSVITGSFHGAWRVVSSVLGIGVVALPVGIGVAILKYRLYEIDRIISRTLAYAIVTALLVGLYAGIVLLTTQVLSFSSPVAVAASTLAAAALFSPLRRRVQRVVDRRFNRARYDADRTIAAFAARLQDAVDPDHTRADLLGTVHGALEPAHVSLWVRPADQA
jgi:hypothetical protein